jgi:glutamine synthetase
MDTIQIKDTKLVRDIHSKAILNTDKAGLQEYYVKKEIAKKQQHEQFETKQKLQKLEQEMAEIKTLLQEIASLRKV